MGFRDRNFRSFNFETAVHYALYLSKGTCQNNGTHIKDLMFFREIRNGQ